MPANGFQTRTVPSKLALAKEPSDNKANAVTPLVCPIKVLSKEPEDGFQIRTVLSLLPLAKEPSDNKTNALTWSVWPVKFRTIGFSEATLFMSYLERNFNQLLSIIKLK